MSRLDGKTAIITGAASGIGRASAQLFAERGAKVLLTDLAEDGLSETLESIRRAGGQAEALAGDAASPEHIAQLLALCGRRFGAPQVLYANAGIAGMQPLLEESLEDWQRILRVNLLGPVVAIKAVAPIMREAGGGAIVLTASVAGLRSGAGSSAYSASKAGVVSLAQTAACQLAPYNIRVNAVCPGIIETGMTQPLFDKARSAGKLDKMGKHNPMQRAAGPREIATLAAFLASDDASFITGQAYTADGGMTATHPFTPGRVI